MSLGSPYFRWALPTAPATRHRQHTQGYKRPRSDQNHLRRNPIWICGSDPDAVFAAMYQRSIPTEAWKSVLKALIVGLRSSRHDASSFLTSDISETKDATPADPLEALTPQT